MMLILDHVIILVTSIFFVVILMLTRSLLNFDLFILAPIIYAQI